MSDEQELKPCPFCGGGDLIREGNCDGDYAQTVCDTCCSCGPFIDRVGGYWKVIESWNTRPIEDAKDARIAELEADYQKASDDCGHWRKDYTELQDRHNRMCENIVAMNENTLRLEQQLAESRKVNLRQRVCDTYGLYWACVDEPQEMDLDVFVAISNVFCLDEYTTTILQNKFVGRVHTIDELVDWLIEQGVEDE